jgi:hypothetical protein
MRLFAKHYPDGEFGQALPDQLTWTHHVVLVQTIDIGQRYFNKLLARPQALSCSAA